MGVDQRFLADWSIANDIYQRKLNRFSKLYYKSVDEAALAIEDLPEEFTQGREVIVGSASYQVNLKNAKGPFELQGEQKNSARYNFRKTIRYYKWLHQQYFFTEGVKRELAKIDRFYLLVYVIKRIDMLHPFVLDRCREVEQNPWGCLDLWARGHYKSTVITFGGSIQQILLDPESKICIFSYRADQAKYFLSEVKLCLETNETLKRLFPDILYEEPSKESPKWNIQGGITVKRNSQPKEATLEAHGVIEGQPIGKHYSHRIYDDVITPECVTNPERMEMVAARCDVSRDLRDLIHRKETYVGTRYAYADYYGTLIQRGHLDVRKHAATHNSQVNGKPVLYTMEKWLEVVRSTPLSVLACQQLLDPLAGNTLAFKQSWLKEYEVRPRTLNIYILVDPAHSRRPTSDRTAMAVLGVDAARNVYVLDGMCHRMSLSERWANLRYFWIKWQRQPGSNMMGCFYERYGAQSDVEHFQNEMERDRRNGNNNTSFHITEVSWTGDASIKSKPDRIRRLEPLFKNASFFWPYGTIMRAKLMDRQAIGEEGLNKEVEEARLAKMTNLQRRFHDQGDDDLISTPIIYKDENAEIYDVMAWVLVHEYNSFPIGHPDWLDAASRLFDAQYTAATAPGSQTFDQSKETAVH